MLRRPSLRVHVPPVPDRQLVPIPRLQRRRDGAQEPSDAAQLIAPHCYRHTSLPFVPPPRIAERGTGGEASRGTGSEPSSRAGVVASRSPSASTCTTSGRLNSGGGSTPLRNISRTLLPDRMTWLAASCGQVLGDAMPPQRRQKNACSKRTG